MFKKIILVAFLATITACAQQRHYVNGYSVEGTKQITNNSDFFVSGLAQKKNIDAQEICGGSDKVVATETILSPMNIVIGAITFGLYTPKEQSVYCKR